MSQSNSGKLGEDAACRFLTSKGYKIIARNFHTRFGEIDIVTLFKNSVVFVEVKTRSGNTFGAPIEAVTPSKLSKLVASAHIYLSQNLKLPKDFSFDVIEVFESGEKLEVQHTKNITL